MEITRQQLQQLADIYPSLSLVQQREATLAIQAIEKDFCEKSLYEFVRTFWHVVEPGREMIEGEVLKQICLHLEGITEGDIRNLLVNVPPGPGWIGNKTLTTRGRITIGDIKLGDSILTHKGRFRKITAIHERGNLPILKITTWSGRVIHSSPDHLFLTPFGWIRAEQLSIETNLAAIVPQQDCLPNLIQPHEARLLGYLIGDGSITHTPAFTNMDADTLSDFQHCASLMGFSTSIRKLQKNRATIINLKGGKIVREWLNSHGLLGKNSYQKFIPAKVLASSNETIRNFIGAYWSCDGMIEVRTTRKRGSSFRSNCSTVSYQLAQDIQHALIRLGINGRIRARKVKRDSIKQKSGIYTSYNVEVMREADTALFALMPITERKRKQAELCRQEFVKPIFEDSIVSIEPIGNLPCRCITVEDDESWTWEDVAVHNCSKSLITDVFWPAWLWGPKNLPDKRFLAFSYSADLTLRDNLRFASIIKSQKYQLYWGNRFEVVKDSESKIINSKTGWKLASSTGGMSTGERADYLLVDDPHNVKDGESEAKRESTLLWWREVVPTRLNDPINSSIVVIMQRVHSEDVSGDILDRGLDFCHLMLPMEYDVTRPCQTELGGDWRAEDGELLWDERFPQFVLDDYKKVMGPYAYASQMQQSPSPRGGGIIKREWWGLWDNDYATRLGMTNPRDDVLVFPPFEFVLGVVDPAYTEKQQNDPSGMVVLGVWRDEKGLAKIMLAYAWEKRLTLHGPPVFSTDTTAQKRAKMGLVEWVDKTCRDYGVNKLLIEAKASGLSLIQELGRLFYGAPYDIEGVNPKAQDKVARTHASVPTYSQGMVYAPDKAWADAVIIQHEQFPNAKHDEYVDVMNYGIAWLRNSGILLRPAEQKIVDDEEMAPLKNLEPLYTV